VAEVDPLGIDGGPAISNQEGRGGAPGAVPMAKPATFVPVHATTNDRDSAFVAFSNAVNSSEAGVTVTVGAVGDGDGDGAAGGCVPPPPLPPPQPANAVQSNSNVERTRRLRRR
jgi:hypothetical protein